MKRSFNFSEESERHLDFLMAFHHHDLSTVVRDAISCYYIYTKRILLPKQGYLVESMITGIEDS